MSLSFHYPGKYFKCPGCLHSRCIENLFVRFIIFSAALATFITSFTTSMGFFSSMVSNVLAIKVFGIFTGTLVAVDYILSVLILSPTLCLYDEMVMKGSQSWLVSLQKSKQEDKHQRNEKRETTANTNEKRLNLLFGMYCDFLYTFR